jgi:ATP adenylyltransferase
VERLWSPWRLAYVTGTSAQVPHPSDCIFCNAARTDANLPKDELVLIRGTLAYVILNLYPYNNGHLMVVPSRHVGSLSAAHPEELAELMRFTRHAEIALLEAYRPQGINIGMNLGRAAGAGVPDHMHVHVVPRWAGDTNFMSVVSDTRVLPEDLSATAMRLRPIFERLSHEP